MTTHQQHQSINMKPSVKVSVKSPVSPPRETSIVDVSKVVGISVGSPVNEVTLGGKVKGYLGGETALIFIGIMVSIVSLAVSLWSMHKNSLLTKRLTELNSSMVDIIVESKRELPAESPPRLTKANSERKTLTTTLPKPSSVSQAQAIRERLREKRASNLESRLALEEQSRKADEVRAEQERLLQKLQLEAAENRKEMERNQAAILVDANKSLRELRERKNIKPIPIMETDPRKRFPEPENPASEILSLILPKNIGKPRDVDKISFDTKILPIIPPGEVQNLFQTQEERIEIDVDDLERDLLFLKG